MTTPLKPSPFKGRLIASMLALLFFAFEIHAAEQVYFYEGVELIEPYPECAEPRSTVNITVTLSSALAPNLDDFEALPLITAYQIYAGYKVYSNENTPPVNGLSHFTVDTDATGNIVAWSWDTGGSHGEIRSCRDTIASGPGASNICANISPGSEIVQCGLGPAPHYPTFQPNVGVWTAATSGAGIGMGVIDAGDRTIVDSRGSPVDGFSFLDISYSAGMTQAAALANAQTTYPDARLAEPTELLYLARAAGATNFPDNGYGFNLSTLAGFGNADVIALQALLGSTSGTDTHLKALGNNRIAEVRLDGATGEMTTGDPSPATAGWLLVSESAPIPMQTNYAVPTFGVLGFTGFVGVIILISANRFSKRHQ